MQYHIPFYANDSKGNHCMQACMQSVLHYFLQTKFSFTDLDALTGHRPGLWTWPHPAAVALHKLGLGVHFYSETDAEPFLEGELYIREHYGKGAEKILAHSDLGPVVPAIREMLALGLFSVQKLTISAVEEYAGQGKVPIILIDNSIISGKQDSYEGHFVVMTGFDEAHVLYHDPGPRHAQAHRCVEKILFEKAWSATGTDRDVILVWKPRGLKPQGSRKPL